MQNLLPLPCAEKAPSGGGVPTPKQQNLASQGYSRLGAAYMGLGQLADAVAGYRKGLDLDPSNEQLRASLEEALAAEEGGLGAEGNVNALFSGPDALAKLATNPSTSGFLAQPDFMQKLQELQRDPSRLGAHINDPRIMQASLGGGKKGGHRWGAGQGTPKGHEK